LEIKDTYKTIETPTEEILFKEKNSKFFGYAFPVTTTEEIKIWIDQLKKQHFGAVHFCYSYQIGTEKIEYRANDDGEPSNSAGIPIYGQIQSFGLTNILIVVVRYFGGAKLGVGGLITAYKTSAQLVLENALIIEKTIDIRFKITFDYKNINKVMRVIKEKQLDIHSQKMEENCELIIVTRRKNTERIFEIFNALFEISILKLD
jgi:uncharacterized YigZ family protein